MTRLDHNADSGWGMDARGAQIGSVGDHNTVIAYFLGADRTVRWRAWFIAPVAAVAIAVWSVGAAAVMGRTLPLILAGAAAVTVLVGLTVWQTITDRREQAQTAREARSAALEPLELPTLPAGAQSVSTLIAPERALNPLESRGKQRTQLVRWCVQEPDLPIRIVDGPSGVGKTRLTVEVGRALPDGWVAGRCVRGRATDVLGLVQACADPTLIVVDDADTQPDVPRLVEQITTTSPGPVKVLLVVRDHAAFHQSMRQHIRGAADANWPVTTLCNDGGAGDRRRWFNRAVTAYADATGNPAPAGIEQDMRPAGEPGETMIVTQVRAALTVLTDSPASASRMRSAPLSVLAAELVVLEQRRWNQAADDPRWKLPKKLDVDGHNEAVLALVALVPASIDDAVPALRRLPRFHKHDDDRLRRIASWAHHVYPGTSTGGVWVDPAPEFVLGALLGHLCTPANSGLVNALDVGAVADRNPEVLVRAARVAPQFPAVESLIATMLDRSPHLMVTAVEYLLRAGPAARHLQRIVAAAVVDHPPAPDTIADLVRLLTGSPWRHLVVALHRGAVHHARSAYDSSRTEDGDGGEHTTETTSALATALHNLAVRLAEAGHRPEALTTAQEAADLYRELAAANRDAYLPGLATSVNNLANRLAEAGRRPEALTTAQEATDLRRDLAAANRDAYLPDLAMSVDNLAVRLAEAGRRPEALTTAQEAADLYRELAEGEPGLWEAQIARATELYYSLLTGGR